MWVFRPMPDRLDAFTLRIAAPLPATPLLLLPAGLTAAYAGFMTTGPTLNAMYGFFASFGLAVVMALLVDDRASRLRDRLRGASFGLPSPTDGWSKDEERALDRLLSNDAWRLADLDHPRFMLGGLLAAAPVWLMLTPATRYGVPELLAAWCMALPILALVALVWRLDVTLRADIALLTPRIAATQRTLLTEAQESTS